MSQPPLTPIFRLAPQRAMRLVPVRPLASGVAATPPAPRFGPALGLQRIWQRPRRQDTNQMPS